MTFVRLLLLLLVAAPHAVAAPPAPSPRDKCPVCGMFVAKFPDWTASLAFRGGKPLYFDGAKDLFRFYHDLPKYAPGKIPADVAEITVNDYYSLEAVPAEKASYVIGSDIYGPMGKELIPFRSRQDAEAFLRDHRGTRIVGFRDVTPSLLKQLE